MDFQVHKVFRVRAVIRVTLVLKVRQVRPVNRAKLVHRVCPDPQVLAATLADVEIAVNRVHLDLPDQLVSPV